MKAIILPVTILGLLSVAFADDIRSEIKPVSDEVCKALSNRDITAFKKALTGKVTADFKYFDTPTAKPMNFDQMVATMKMGLSQMSKVTLADERLLSTSKQVGDSITVLTIHHMTGLTTPGPDKKTHSMSFAGVSTDVYKKVGGKWLLSSMTWKSTEQKMDGHRMKPGM
jgi:hypothetical protein